MALALFIARTVYTMYKTMAIIAMLMLHSAFHLLGSPRRKAAATTVHIEYMIPKQCDM